MLKSQIELQRTRARVGPSLLVKAKHLLDTLYPESDAIQDREIRQFRDTVLRQLKVLEGRPLTEPDEAELQRFIQELKTILANRSRIDQNLEAHQMFLNIASGNYLGPGASQYTEIHGDVTINPSAVAQKNLPETWNLPLQNQNFVGRDKLLKKIEGYFIIDTQHLVLTACHGLGGIGKTQLALEFAWQQYQSFRGVCWFNAENRERLLADYVNLGQELHIISAAEKVPNETGARRVKHWLEHSDRKGWLLIYDNAEKRDDIDGLLPSKGGKILITSRHSYWPGFYHIPIDVFDLTEARIYVKKVIGESKFNHDPQSVDILIEMLGRLPLALAQACAYISRPPGVSVSSYIDSYKAKHQALSAENLLPKDQYQKSVAVTWNVTLEQMQQESPESVELIYICAYLHHTSIPRQLIQRFFQAVDEAELTLKVTKAMRVAEEYSMIRQSEKRALQPGVQGSLLLGFSIHILVQQVIQDNHAKNMKEKYVKEIVSLLNILFGATAERSKEEVLINRVLFPHVTNIVMICDKINFVSEALVVLHLKYANYVFKELADDMLAFELLNKAQTLLDQNFPANKIIRARILHDLGNVLFNQRKYSSAEKKYKESLDLMKDNPDEKLNYAIGLHQLANTYSRRGNFDEALKLYYEALALNTHGDKINPYSASNLHEIANILSLQNEHEEAIDAIETAYQTKLKYYSEHSTQDNPDIAITLDMYGIILVRANKYKEAKDKFKEALAIYKKTYGDKHREYIEVRARLLALGGTEKDVSTKDEMQADDLDLTHMQRRPLRALLTLQGAKVGGDLKLSEDEDTINAAERFIKSKTIHVDTHSLRLASARLAINIDAGDNVDLYHGNVFRTLEAHSGNQEPAQSMPTAELISKQWRTLMQQESKQEQATSTNESQQHAHLTENTSAIPLPSYETSGIVVQGVTTFQPAKIPSQPEINQPLPEKMVTSYIV